MVAKIEKRLNKTSSNGCGVKIGDAWAGLSGHPNPGFD